MFVGLRGPPFTHHHVREDGTAAPWPRGQEIKVTDSSTLSGSPHLGPSR